MQRLLPPMVVSQLQLPGSSLMAANQPQLPGSSPMAANQPQPPGWELLLKKPKPTIGGEMLCIFPLVVLASDHATGLRPDSEEHAQPGNLVELYCPGIPPAASGLSGKTSVPLSGVFLLHRSRSRSGPRLFRRSVAESQ